MHQIDAQDAAMTLNRLVKNHFAWFDGLTPNEKKSMITTYPTESFQQPVKRVGSEEILSLADNVRRNQPDRRLMCVDIYAIL